MAFGVSLDLHISYKFKIKNKKKDYFINALQTKLFCTSKILYLCIIKKTVNAKTFLKKTHNLYTIKVSLSTLA